ncbi:CDP-glucose 4,6-dehydratase [Falsiroseomonas oryziterrae]|uniref:CDP-glucose 4,6-dehydratase n=1 Tax=Falsiroseomonas oryziterrae TaxID=2911368 RepID=UPI001F00EEFA|nr:CDP-glucose 4,6-dehydratase [Roseomonas sp. NPKOSM-4]
MRQPDPAFWRGRRVLLTGHTGFKGAWLARMLARLGAEVTGLALDPEPGPSAFAALRVADALAADHRADIRDPEAVGRLLRGARPEVVLHLAAQALVGRGHRDPAGTFATNVAGTVHVLEALRGLPGVLAAVIVTSDKVYRNDGTGRRFAEDDPLGGADPYSASKAAAEIAVASWRASFADLPPLATARAGNVLGGGDFGQERLVPDLVRAQIEGRPLLVRRPDATRPFQHVLDVLRGYLLLAEALAEGTAPAAVNFGPSDAELRVRDLLALWGEVEWEPAEGPVMAEAPRLALESSLAGRALGWEPRLDTPRAIAATAAWYAAWRAGEDMARAAEAEIAAALDLRT